MKPNLQGCSRLSLWVWIIVVGGVGLVGCTQQSLPVSSQKQSNWTTADPAAMSAAEPESEPDIRPDTFFAAGHLFERQGSTNKAILQYQKTLAGNPRHIGALNRLGVLYSGAGRHGEAESVLRRAVEVQPDSALLRNNLGYEYMLQNRWADAQAEFGNAISLKPEFARAHINLGMALSKLDRFDEGLVHFRAVLPEADALYNLGLMLRSKHHYMDAARAFGLALDADPAFTAARVQIERMAPQLELSTDLEPQLGAAAWLAMARTTAIPVAKHESVESAWNEEVKQVTARADGEVLPVALTGLPADEAVPTEEVALPATAEEIVTVPETPSAVEIAADAVAEVVAEVVADVVVEGPVEAVVEIATEAVVEIEVEEVVEVEADAGAEIYVEAGDEEMTVVAALPPGDAEIATPAAVEEEEYSDSAEADETDRVWPEEAGPAELIESPPVPAPSAPESAEPATAQSDCGQLAAPEWLSVARQACALAVRQWESLRPGTCHREPRVERRLSFTTAVPRGMDPLAPLPIYADATGDAGLLP